MERSFNHLDSSALINIDNFYFFQSLFLILTENFQSVFLLLLFMYNIKWYIFVNGKYVEVGFKTLTQSFRLYQNIFFPWNVFKIKLKSSFDLSKNVTCFLYFVWYFCFLPTFISNLALVTECPWLKATVTVDRML